MARRKNRKNLGFTLAELLIVVAIIGVLVAISIPIMSGSLRRARAAVCLSNRRSLLTEVSINAQFDEQKMGDAFAALYPDNEDMYTCPEGGNYSWSGQQIVCDKHPDADSGGGQASSVSVGGGLFQVQLDNSVDTVQYKKGDTITVQKGKVFQVGDKYYIGVDNFSPRKISNDNYEKWLKDSYMATEIRFDRQYTQEDLGTGGKLNGYSGNAPVGVGSVYSFGGKLYIQKSGFTGNTPTQSSDPTVNTNYWSLLGNLV